MNSCLMPWAILLNFFRDHQCDAYYLAPAFDGSIDFLGYLPYFLKTILIELPVFYVFLRQFKTFKEVLLINLVLNLITHPIVFFVISAICSKLNLSYLTYLIIAETFAPIVEGLVLILMFKIPLKHAALAALFANLMSWSIGVWL